MILRVILKNFLSFNDEVQFDMFPNMKRTTLSNHITMLNEKLPVLKMAAIYGANGAGKSNLLKGINFLKAIALNKSFLDKDTFGKSLKNAVLKMKNSKLLIRPMKQLPVKTLHLWLPILPIHDVLRSKHRML